MWCQGRTSALFARLALVGLAVSLVAVPPAAGEAPTLHTTAAKAAVTKRVLGKSRAGRAIVAYRLGEPGRKVVVALAAMHGNEAAPSQILRALKNGPAIHGVDLWVVPRYNPDGVAAHTRGNGRGVDLNRNFPYHWVNLDGAHESGTGPASEPETRAMMRFLRAVKPARIISFHQPLYGVDTDTKDRAFARKLARALKLPRKTFDCGGVCHGTLTGWYNHRFAGAALTVEYGPHPPKLRLTRQAPRALIKVLGGTRGAAG